MEEEKKPIKIVCPYCGKATTIIYRETHSGWEEGILYDLYCDCEVTDCDHLYIEWEYFCNTCGVGLDCEEVEELMDAVETRPLPEQLMMESGIDLFEGFWGKDKD